MGWNNQAIYSSKDGVYTFSAYVKSSAGESSHVQLIVSLNDKRIKDEGIGSNFDCLRNSFQVTLKTGDRIYAQYNMTSSGTLWTAGHKWEEGSVATPHMPSASEAKTSDWPATSVSTQTLRKLIAQIHRTTLGV